MAKHKRYKTSSKCPEPISTMIDLACAAAVGSMVKHRVKNAYAKGYGPESAAAAASVFGYQAMRRGGDGLIGLGGLYGVNSALKDIERSRHLTVERAVLMEDTIEVSEYQVNDNRYAWRLNCKDGSAYGIYPEDYETRDEYNLALEIAQFDASDYEVPEEPEKPDSSESPAIPDLSDLEVFTFCKVSRLDNGANEYYIAYDLEPQIGDIVLVPVEERMVRAVVLSVERHMRMTAPQEPEETDFIMAIEYPDEEE